MSAICAHLRSAIIESCQVRGDSKDHAGACMRDCLELADTEWPWYVEYFQGVIAAWKAVEFHACR